MNQAFLTYLFFSFFFFGQACSLEVNLASEYAVLMNADTGAVLFEKDAHTPYYPASITKIATALYVLNKKENSLDEIATADQDAIGSITEEQKIKSNYKLPSYRMVVGGSHIGLKNGEQMSIKDLLYGLMLASGDDAANVLAKHLSGTIPAFMDELNLFIKELGLANTTFTNPHGLHHPQNQTTAYEMAILTKEALKNATFAQIVSTPRYSRPKTNKQDPIIWGQTNRLLRQGPYFYPKAIGVKTGSGFPALKSLVAAAQHEGRTLIAVLMHCKDKDELYKDAITLFEAAFSEQKVQRTLLSGGRQKYALELEGSKPVPSYIENSITIQFYPSEEPGIKAQIIWDKASLPIAEGSRIGEIQLLTSEGKLIKAIPLLAAEERSLWWWQKILN